MLGADLMVTLLIFGFNVLVALPVSVTIIIIGAHVIAGAMKK